MKHWILTIVISLLVSSSLLLGYHLIYQDKIGYVRSGELLTKYKGMIATNEQFQKEMNLVQTNIDTLKARYEALRNQRGIADKELGYKLGVAENEYMNYQNSANDQMEMRRQTLAKSVLDKVNKFIQDYADQHHYDYILGSTNEGIILKGKESADLTEKILTELNSSYDKELSKTKEKNAN